MSPITPETIEPPGADPKDSNGRPDPITGRVTLWATIGTIVAGLIATGIDLGWKAPVGNNVMDWIRSLLPVVIAYFAVRQGAALAKERTTPLADPKTADGHDLVPADIPPPGGAPPIDPGY